MTTKNSFKIVWLIIIVIIKVCNLQVVEEENDVAGLRSFIPGGLGVLMK